MAENVCIHGSSERLTLYFYGELPPEDRRVFEGHLASCTSCAAALGELELLRSALAPRGVAGPPPAERDAFMQRLLARIDEGDRVEPTGSRPSPEPLWRWLTVAAVLVLAVGSGLIWQRQALAPPMNATQVAERGEDGAALSDAAARHFERAKLVVLGIAMKDPTAVSPADWEYERELAASLLPETRLFRLTASDRGDTRLASLLDDLENVLLQASMATDADAPELQRLQRTIERRDLLIRMDLREL